MVEQNSGVQNGSCTTSGTGARPRVGCIALRGRRRRRSGTPSPDRASLHPRGQHELTRTPHRRHLARRSVVSHRWRPRRAGRLPRRHRRRCPAARGTARTTSRAPRGPRGRRPSSASASSSSSRPTSASAIAPAGPAMAAPLTNRYGGAGVGVRVDEVVIDAVGWLVGCRDGHRAVRDRPRRSARSSSDAAEQHVLARERDHERPRVELEQRVGQLAPVVDREHDEVRLLRRVGRQRPVRRAHAPRSADRTARPRRLRLLRRPSTRASGIASSSTAGSSNERAPSGVHT